ncbi:MAG: hypothetical protein ACKVPX_04920 [Myxococcaceae bacterium]
MTRLNLWAFGFLSILLTAPAMAQRVSVTKFVGDSKGNVRAQIAKGLCAQIECVPPSRILTRNKVDFKKVSRSRVDGVLSGTLKGPKAKRTVVVKLLSASRELLWSETFALRKGKLRPADNRAISNAVVTLFPAQRTKPEEPPAADTSAVPPAAPPSAPVTGDRPFFSDGAAEKSAAPPATPPTSEPSSVVSAETEPDAASDAPPAAAVSTDTGRPRHPYIVADLGLNLMWRSFTYDALTSGNLLGYRGLGIVAPSIRVEGYPLAGMPGLIEGLGLFGEFGISIGLGSRLDENTRFPSTLSWWKAGARWNIRPIWGSTFSFGPELAFRGQDFTTGAAEDGSVLTDLPDLHYRILEVGLHAEIPLGGFAVFHARAAYLAVLSAADLLGPGFFPNGSGGGLELEGGIGVYLGLGELLQARLTGFWTRVGLGFQPDAAAAFQATGSGDSYYGGRLSLRLRY